MKPFTSSPAVLVCLALLSVASLSRAILVQPHNFAPDDQAEEASGFLLEQDLLRLARLRDARTLQLEAAPETESNEEHFSQEMADLIHREHQHQIEKQQQQNAGEAHLSEPSLSESVAHVLMNVARAAQAQQTNEEQQSAGSDSSSGNGQQQQQPAAEMSSRGNIMELDTSAGSGAGHSLPSKADLKQSGPKQWFNPKETIPVLKISSMATPSKYKKVYFRAEKKLVDGAFHSPSNEKEDKKSLMKSSSFNSGVQRRSSRGTSSSVPPGILQDGVIDFLKKFRDVYIQTRPVGTASASSSLASSFLASAASSPLASILAPAAGSSRPNLASALSAATSMIGSAAQVAQAASASPASSSSSSSSASAASSALGAAGAATGAASNSAKGPLTAQSYVSFWSKTFPTWVRKMLKQMRRRSLHNSSKRNQQHQHHSGASSIGQAAASVASAVEQASEGSSSSSSSSSSSKQT